MPDLSQLAQRAVSEYVLVRLGRQAPHDDALDIIELEREASPQVRESLRRAVVELLELYARDSNAFDADAGADLLTLAAFLLDPAHPMDIADRALAVRSLCTLADSGVEEVARRSRGVLLTLRAPSTADFWLNLDRSSRHPPDAATVFQGLSEVGLGDAFRHLAGQIAGGESATGARALLVDWFRRIEHQDRTAAREAFVRFLDSGFDQATRLILAEAPSLAGLDWPIRELPSRARLVALLRSWRSLCGAGEDPMSLRFDVIRSEVVGLLGDVFPLFDKDQFPVIYDGLTTGLRKPPGDRLAVESMMAIHLEDELARRVLAQIEDHSWELAAWYLRVSEWIETAGARAELVAALYRALGDGERTPFLYAILEARPEAPEIMQNSGIDGEHVFKLESVLIGAYSKAGGVLSSFEGVVE